MFLLFLFFFSFFFFFLLGHTCAPSSSLYPFFTGPNTSANPNAFDFPFCLLLLSFYFSSGLTGSENGLWTKPHFSSSFSGAPRARNTLGLLSNRSTVATREDAGSAFAVEESSADEWRRLRSRKGSGAGVMVH